MAAYQYYTSSSFRYHLFLPIWEWLPFVLYYQASGVGCQWHAPTKDTTSYVRVKDSLASGSGGNANARQ